MPGSTSKNKIPFDFSFIASFNKLGGRLSSIIDLSQISGLSFTDGLNWLSSSDWRYTKTLKDVDDTNWGALLLASVCCNSDEYSYVNVVPDSGLPTKGLINRGRYALPFVLFADESANFYVAMPQEYQTCIDLLCPDIGLNLLNVDAETEQDFVDDVLLYAEVFSTYKETRVEEQIWLSKQLKLSRKDDLNLSLHDLDVSIDREIESFAKLMRSAIENATFELSA
ncbi:hypothetical protein [Aliagarivorans marinus]|uniref:hypothetical protein n=1 Tax=Aliagarivorans marinus TaxID=561965 RepID=UPI00040BF3B6|nr:hypothetical protein [Aliagarivorans marinus]